MLLLGRKTSLYIGRDHWSGRRFCVSVKWRPRLWKWSWPLHFQYFNRDKYGV